MRLNFSRKLKELRNENNVTQEQLANYLKISSQAVSKWERNEGYPDIELLPRIALFFGVSVDRLLGVGEERIKEHIDMLYEESNKLRNMGELEKDLELWERAYREFPNEHRVMIGLMYAISDIAKGNSDELLYSAIDLGEKVLEETADSRIREDAVYLLCGFYNTLGDEKAAQKCAMMMGDYFTSCGQLLTRVLSGEKRLMQRRNNIRDIVELFWNNTVLLASETELDRSDKIYCYKKAIDFIKSVYDDGDFGFASVRLYTAYLYLAHEYAALADSENCISALESCAQYAVLYDTQDIVEHTSFLVRGLEYHPERTSKNYKETTASMFFKRMELPDFDFIRDDERFMTIQKELEAFL